MDQPPTSSDRPALRLQYAHPRTAADPFPEAEALIVANANVAAYRRLFETAQEAMNFYVSFQTRRFSAAALDHICKGCGEPTPHAIAITRVIFESRTFRFDLNGSRQHATLETHHSLCDNCFQRTRRLARLHRLALAFFAALALFGILSLFLPGLRLRWQDTLNQWLGGALVPLSFAVVAMAGLAIAVVQDTSHLPLPPALRKSAWGWVRTIRRSS
jgi:hypothetical protein